MCILNLQPLHNAQGIGKPMKRTTAHTDATEHAHENNTGPRGSDATERAADSSGIHTANVPPWRAEMPIVPFEPTDYGTHKWNLTQALEHQIRSVARSPTEYAFLLGEWCPPPRLVAVWDREGVLSLADIRFLYSNLDELHLDLQDANISLKEEVDNATRAWKLCQQYAHRLPNNINLRLGELKDSLMQKENAQLRSTVDAFAVAFEKAMQADESIAPFLDDGASAATSRPTPSHTDTPQHPTTDDTNRGGDRHPLLRMAPKWKAGRACLDSL